MSVAKPPRHKAIQAIINVFDWYPSHYSPLERKLLRKLDSSLLVFASLSVSSAMLRRALANLSPARSSSVNTSTKAISPTATSVGCGRMSV